MPVIPREIYTLVEKRLQDRHALTARARAALYDAQAAAMAVTAPASDGIKTRGGPGDRTQAGAMRVLAAEKRLKDAEKWEEAFRLADKALPFETTPEGVVAAYLYGNGMTVEECCRATGRGRSTVIHLRDNYVAHCAIFAAGQGLIRMEEDGKNETGEG